MNPSSPKLPSSNEGGVHRILGRAAQNNSPSKNSISSRNSSIDIPSDHEAEEQFADHTSEGSVGLAQFRKYGFKKKYILSIYNLLNFFV